MPRCSTGIPTSKAVACAKQDDDAESRKVRQALAGTEVFGYVHDNAFHQLPRGPCCLLHCSSARDPPMPSRPLLEGRTLSICLTVPHSASQCLSQPTFTMWTACLPPNLLNTPWLPGILLAHQLGGQHLPKKPYERTLYGGPLLRRKRRCRSEDSHSRGPSLWVRP